MLGYNFPISKASTQSLSPTLALANLAGVSFLLYLFALVLPMSWPLSYCVVSFWQLQLVRFCQATLDILLFYLLLTCTWFQQWYLVWPLCVAALLPPGPAVYLALLSGGYTLLSKHLVFGPLIFKLYPLPASIREIWFAPSVWGLPWLYMIVLIKDHVLWRFKKGAPELKVLERG